MKATNGLVTRFAYDILDNLIGVTMLSNLKTTYIYDVKGNVISMTDTMHYGISGMNNNPTRNAINPQMQTI